MIVISNPPIHLPVTWRRWSDCGSHSPVNSYRCNRPKGHGGRHLFYHRHIDGLVREVWGQRG